MFSARLSKTITARLAWNLIHIVLVRKCPITESYHVVGTIVAHKSAQSNLYNSLHLTRTVSISEQSQLVPNRALHLWHICEANHLDKQTCWPTVADEHSWRSDCSTVLQRSGEDVAFNWPGEPRLGPYDNGGHVQYTLPSIAAQHAEYGTEAYEALYIEPAPEVPRWRTAGTMPLAHGASCLQ